MASCAGKTIPARMKYYGMHGVDYISHHKEAQHHRDKVIEYEQATVARSPLTIARVQAAATVFDFPGVKRDCVLSLTVSACVAMLSLLFAVDDRAENALQALTDIGTVVSQGLFFLLGPYLGLCLARWWQMRLDFVGGVWGVVADLNTWAATWFHSGSDADKAARRLMLRYGLAAHMLLFKGARGDDEQLDAMVKAGLLTSREQRQLQGSEAKGIPGAPSKSQMIFAWIVAFWSRALAPDQGGLGTTKIPNAEQLAPMVLRRCADGPWCRRRRPRPRIHAAAAGLCPPPLPPRPLRLDRQRDHTRRERGQHPLEPRMRRRDQGGRRRHATLPALLPALVRGRVRPRALRAVRRRRR